MLVDGFFDPLFYADLQTGEYLAIHAFKMTNWLSLDRDTYESIIRDAIDPYLFIRAAYAQRRLAQIGETSYDLDALFDADTYHPLKWNW
jgi:phospholipid-binding lipoprotein MlaA